MRSTSPRLEFPRSIVFSGLLGVLLFGAATVSAVVQKPATSELDSLAKPAPSYWAGRIVQPYNEVRHSVANGSQWVNLLGPSTEGTRLFFDRATGEPSLVQGAPIPMIPGRGNDLTMTDVSARLSRSVDTVDASIVQGLIERFMDEHAALLPVGRSEISHRKTSPVNDHLWASTFHHVIDGVPVASSRMTFVVSHGNLVLWGSENIFSATAEERLSLATTADGARTAVRSYIDWQDGADTWTSDPELVYIPQPGGRSDLVAGAEGKDHRLVWELTLQRKGVVGHWMAQVDAATGSIVQFGDLNRYGSIRGGIEPTTWTDTEESRPMPLVSLLGGGFSTMEGQFTGPETGSLDGELTELSDQCGAAGAPSVASVAGDMDFGTGPANPLGDADCTTNGVGTSGGAHNTHAARSAYYHITRLKDKARSWLPSNSFVDSSHEVRVNIDDACNAYWDPVNGFNGFFREGFYSGIHCFNTGEIRGVFQHEVGHAMDQNDVQGTADGGTGEAYGDVMALLDQHASCTGQEFWEQQCTGYGLPCTECTSVRDQDYAKHETAGGVPITDPFTPANFTGPFCPGGLFSAGPCGQEVHCEAYPAGGAVWDLAVRKLVPGLEQESAWYTVERNFMLGMDIATGMFNCNSTTFASDGCAATSWFMALLAADDDDGNLANGTPHAADIFEAFDDHAIACGSAGDASNQSTSGCPSLAAPSASISAVGDDWQISWTPVANAVGYGIFKNHGECTRGINFAATVASPLTTFLDTDVDPNAAYAYRVVALGAAGDPTDNTCYSELSACLDSANPFSPIFNDGFDTGTTIAWDTTVAN